MRNSAPIICLIIGMFVAVDRTMSQDGGSLSGTVVSSDDGMPIVGASVLVLNTMIGTATDENGNFMLLHIPKNRSSLSVSALGYKTTVIPLSTVDTAGLRILMASSPIQTQTVVITANKRPQSLEEIPVSMSIIDAQMIEKRNIIALDDALRYVPGVHFQQSQVNIRASSGYSKGVGSRVMMLMDGVPLLAGDTGEITFESIPVFQIDRVEVVKGAGSALYGSGALGGVINVLTKEISDQSQFWWKLYGGFYSKPAYPEWDWSDKVRFLNGQSVGLSTRIDNIGLAASFRRVSDDGYREQDWLRRYHGFVKMKIDISPVQSFTAATNVFQQYRGDFLWWKDLKNALRPADAQRNVSVSSLRFNNSTQYKHFVSDDFFYEVKGVHFRSNWYRDSLSNKRLDESVSDAVHSEFQGNYWITKEHMLTFGLSVNGERVFSNIFGVHDARGGALFIHEEYLSADNLTLSGGVRFDLQRVTGLSTHSQVNPKFGIRYTIDDRHTVRGSFGKGFRAPSIGELFTSTKNTGSSAIIVPSRNLQPERSSTYEIGTTNVLTEHVRFEGALFHSDFHDLIEPSVQSDTILKAVTVNFKNITQARIQGFEASLFMHYWEKTLTVDLHYNYNWAVDTKTKTFLRFRPRHIAGLNAEYTSGHYSLSADYRFLSRIEAIDDKLVELAPVKNGSQRVPIHVVDARLAADLLFFTFPLRAAMNFNNVLGYNYNELIGNVSPPRHFVFSLEGVVR